MEVDTGNKIFEEAIRGFESAFAFGRRPGGVDLFYVLDTL